MKVNSLFEVYKLYCEHLKLTKLNSKTDPAATIKTALIRYTLPGFGMSETLTKEQQIQFMRQVPIAKMKSLIEVQNNVYQVYEEQGKPVASGSQRTYRWALSTMLQWCEQQSWWLAQADTLLSEKAREAKRRENRKVTDRGKTAPFLLTLQEIRLASAKQTGQPMNEENTNEFNDKPEWFL